MKLKKYGQMPITKGLRGGRVMEVTLSMIIVELEDGSFRADCPEFGFSVAGKSEAEASANLKAEAKRRAKEAKRTPLR